MSLSDARERGQFGVLVAFGLHHDEERVELRYGWSSGLMDEAARYGQLGVIEWLHAHRFEGCTHLAMRFAAERGHLKIVQWLHANRGVRCTRKVMDEAAKNGHLHVVQWLHDNRSEGCTQLAMDSAARNGHLCLVQWLHENRLEGCATKAMDGAAKRGHLPVVQWLHESRTEGCTQKAMDGAAGNGELALVQWLHSSRSEGCTKKAMDKAAANGHLAVVQWLHKNRHEGCTEEAMDRAAGSGHLAIVQWLHENRSEGCTRWAMDGAAINSHASVVAWLDENRKEGCSPSVVDRVLELGQLDIMKTLYDRDELKSWPYPTQVNHLVGQLKSGDPKRLAILSYIASKRKERFCTNAVDNPRCVRDEEAAVVYRTAQSNAERQPYRLMAEKIMSMRRKLPDVIGEHVSGFILDNPTKRWRRSDARKRGWVFWLMQFSIYQNEDMVRLGKYGHWDGARKIHDYLSAKKQLHCTKYFLYLSVAKADLEFAQWHLRMCGAHSVREWLYLATWIGRVDIVEWMCEAWSELRLLKRKVGERDVCAKEHFRSSSGQTAGDLYPGSFKDWSEDEETTDQESNFEVIHFPSIRNRIFQVSGPSITLPSEELSMQLQEVDNYLNRQKQDDMVRRKAMKKTLFRSVDASYSEVKERFLLDMFIIEKTMDSGEEAARDGERFHVDAFIENEEGPVTTNLADLAAMNGHLDIVAYLHEVRNVKCTVTGLYGCIARFRFNIAQYVYEKQPEHANWPRQEDGPDVLRDLLEPSAPSEMINFFRQERDMRLDSYTLEKAVFSEDLERVRLIVEMDLVDSMTIAPDIAAIRGNFEILKVLCDGAQDTAFSSRARNEAAELGQLGIVQYLHERNAPCTCQAMDLASANGHLDVVKFLHGNRTEGCSQYAMYWASKNGHADVVRYLTGALVSIDNCVAVASTQGHSDVVAILESKRAVYERKYGLQWSSAARARRRRLQHQHLLVNPGPGRVVLHELEKEFLSI